MWMYRANNIKVDFTVECEEKSEGDNLALKVNEDMLKPTHFLKICLLLQLAGSNLTTGSHKSDWSSTQQTINCLEKVCSVDQGSASSIWAETTTLSQEKQSTEPQSRPTDLGGGKDHANH